MDDVFSLGILGATRRRRPTPTRFQARLVFLDEEQARDPSSVTGRYSSHASPLVKRRSPIGFPVAPRCPSLRLLRLRRRTLRLPADAFAGSRLRPALRSQPDKLNSRIRFPAAALWPSSTRLRDSTVALTSLKSPLRSREIAPPLQDAVPPCYLARSSRLWAASAPRRAACRETAFILRVPGRWPRCRRASPRWPSSSPHLRRNGAGAAVHCLAV